jgi:hypothetical protein
MGGWDIEKAEDFGLYMQHNNIDVGFLNDIRLTVNECEIAKRKLKSLFVEDCHISASAIEDPGTSGGKVGGQLVIVRGAWRNAVRNCTTDRAGLGGLMVIYLKTKCHEIAIANTYWPTIPIIIPPIAAADDMVHQDEDAVHPKAATPVMAKGPTHSTASM